MQNISRRSILSTGALGTAILLFGSQASASATNTSRNKWRLLGTAPEPLTLPASANLQNQIVSLFADENRIYYGYGDYTTNTGPTNVSYLDVKSGQHHIAYPNALTEQNRVFRQCGNTIYVPSVDPTLNRSFETPFVCGSGKHWSQAPASVPGLVHGFDVTSGLRRGEFYYAGATDANGGSATIWKTLDGGKSWSVLFSDQPKDKAEVDGFARNYWLVKIGDNLYSRANYGFVSQEIAPFRKYNMRTRKTIVLDDKNLPSGSIPGTYSPSYNVLGSQIYDPTKVVSNGRCAYMIDTKLMYFNGDNAVITTNMPFGAGQVSQFVGNSVYALSANYLFKVTNARGVKITELPPGIAATSIAADERHVYVGTNDSKIWLYEL